MDNEFPIDEKYMRRALQLAANGRGFTRSNPMVGAVIVAPDGRVIGEGWHRKYGCGHAEVNAVESVAEADKPLLPESTIYVTLEPCSHYGKTPPCAKLLIDCRIPYVVVGAGDPNPKVNGRGITMLREAGAKVATGVLAEESIALNEVFFTSQTQHRPYIFLKWAQSADGFMDVYRNNNTTAAFRFSNNLSSLSSMKLRSEFQGIMTTAATFLADSPQLTLRNWEGIPPRRFVFDPHGRLAAANVELPEGVTLIGNADPFQTLYNEYGITSVLVEAGPRYLNELLKSDLWDQLRVEISPDLLGDNGAHRAPAIPASSQLVESANFGDNRFLFYRQKKKLEQNGKI